MENLPTMHGVGYHLRKVREEKLLTLDDVASYLRLNKDLIDDIENGKFNKFPTTYLRGYVRSYAKLLAITDSQVFQTPELAHRDTLNTNGWKPFYSHKQITASNKSIQGITFTIISILVVLVALWWKSDNSLNINLGANDSTSNNIPYTVAKNDVERKK